VTAVIVEQTHHVDASDPDEPGMYQWRYEYDLYRFSDGVRSLIARSYTDENDDAHFLRVESPKGIRALRSTDFGDELLIHAVAHLRRAGKTSIRYLGPKGYLPLPSRH
jgi:hypothetical protein